MVIPPIVHHYSGSSLEHWICDFSGRSLCLQHHFYLWFFSPPAALRSFHNSLWKYAGECSLLWKAPRRFKSTCSIVSKVTLCAGLCQQLGLRWHSSLAVCGPLQKPDKQWEEESSSGDASVESFYSFMVERQSKTRCGGYGCPIVLKFFKRLISFRSHTQSSEMLISPLFLIVWGKWEVLYPKGF